MVLKQPPKPTRISTAADCPQVSDLADWLRPAIAQPQASLQVKLRGNILHVLCQTPVPIQLEAVLFRMVEFLVKPAQREYLSAHFPGIYQIFFYSRVVGQSRPDWTAPIFLNRLERHLKQLSEVLGDALTAADRGGLAKLPQIERVQALNSAIVLGNLSLAKRGDPDAIAHYLSETLSALGVGVWASLRAVPGRAKVTAPQRDRLNQSGAGLGDSSASEQAPETEPRLWILCEASYSPDAALIAGPTAQLLRNLKLSQFRDAVLLVQVAGEERLDWMLRVDLTPPEEMLRDWGRWGDEAALRQLVAHTLHSFDLAPATTRKGTSLHIVCQPPEKSADKGSVIPPQTPIVDKLSAMLETLAPQGIQRAMIYGQGRDRAVPAWVKCLDLPALSHPALAEPPLKLAKQADLGALTFLIGRLLNPDLPERLATGGVRVQVLNRDQLLHVMVDAPICPTRRWTLQRLAKWLRQLRPDGIEGVRLYGRRAGQKKPAWSYGIDFKARDRKLIPSAAPEFSASHAYVGDLLTPDGDAPQREDLTPEDLRDRWRQWRRQSFTRARQGLIRSQLFTAAPETETEIAARPHSLGHKGVGVALLWGMAGLLLAIQTDWIFGQLLTSPEPAAPGEVSSTSGQPSGQSEGDQSAEGDEPTQFVTNPDLASQANDPADYNWDEGDWNQGDWDQGEMGEFNDDGGTADGSGFTELPSSNFTQPVPIDRSALRAADRDRAFVSLTALLEQSPYPSFKSQQMDEKLALYHQHLAESGPPDVLILGSSRALRGVDPAALSQRLADLGYGELDIFNFGINGSTAQVVDFTLRQLLQRDQLPKLIIWADGARALNSGRLDVTYNGIEVSEGYRALVSGQLPGGLPESEANESADGEINAVDPAMVNPRTLRESYQAVDRWLSDRLAQVSSAHSDRDRLKTGLRSATSELLTAWVPGTGIPAELAVGSAKLNADGLVVQDANLVDYDGFLPLSLQFNPATYYQNHARVSGSYDGDYEDFRLAGRQVDALESLLDFTQAQDIPVVFVNTPLTDIYLDAYRTRAENEFLREMLQRSATRSGFVFRDLGQLWPDQYGYFSDPSHLNRYGAFQVAVRLAEDPIIPWPSAQETEAP